MIHFKGAVVMSNKRKIKGSNVQILMGRAASVRPGSINIATIRHDDWCSIWSAGQNMTNCNCRPEIDIHEVGENAPRT